MKLKLNRALCLFDLETTGVNVGSDRIVEIAVLKILPDGSEPLSHPLVHPALPIPAMVVAIHGISDEQVANEATFAQIAH